MRQTIEQTEEAKAFFDKVNGLSQEARDHFKIVLEQLIICYTDDKAHAVLVVDHEDSPRTVMIAINANEMEAAQLLDTGARATMGIVMDDMPDKGMLN
jgi:hypothetical protein